MGSAAAFDNPSAAEPDNSPADIAASAAVDIASAAADTTDKFAVVIQVVYIPVVALSIAALGSSLAL